VISFIIIRPYIPETGKKNASQGAYVTICGLAVTLTFDLLTAKSD